MLAAEGGLAATAEGLIVPVVGLGSLGYALFRISRNDANWDGLIAGLKDENRRKDDTLASQGTQIEKLNTRLAELSAWEHQRETVLKDVEEKDKAYHRVLDRLSVAQISLARYEGAMQAAGIDPKAVAALSKDVDFKKARGETSSSAIALPQGTTPRDPDGGWPLDRVILLLDDDPLARGLVTDMIGLTRPSWTIRQVGTLEEAMSADMHDIHVVVSDWKMADGETTVAFVKHVRDNHPTKFVVVLTGADAAMVSSTLKEFGAEGVSVLDKLEQSSTRLRDVIKFVDDSAI